MNEEQHSALALTEADAHALLRRAIRIIVIFGVLASLALWVGSGWRNAAMLATGAAISVASLYEWQRMIRIVNSRLGGDGEGQKMSASAAVMVLFFLLRLLVFAGAIYVSLKCFQGSAVALLCGLGLAVLATLWEALRLLRN
jgi:hypothetical protein